MEFHFGFFDDLITPSGQKKEKLEPMGPSHPCWGFALEEVESLLQQAGRVYDPETVSSIATNHEAWGELITDACRNMDMEVQRNRFQFLIDSMSEIREETASQSRIEKLFGSNTKIGK